MTKELKTAMDLWRKGLGPFPAEYVELHKEAAEKSLKEMFEKWGLRMIASEMISDGWGDGMKVLRAVCEDPFSGKLRDIRWSDANGGSWFECAGHGKTLLDPTPTVKPGYI